jgi:WD40 repeat protein
LKSILAFAASPDGKMFAVVWGRLQGEGRLLRLYDTASGKEIVAPNNGNGNQVMALAFSPDGNFLLTAEHLVSALAA